MTDLPVRMRYRVCSVGVMSALCSAVGIAVLYIISGYICLRYNGTPLYHIYETASQHSPLSRGSELRDCSLFL